MKIIPITLRQANKFINIHHRHNQPLQGMKFAIGLKDVDGELIGVGVVGRPVARALDDGITAEITRVCVLEGHKNANSKIYGRLVQICRLMGYSSVITYTLTEETGSSIKAVGGKIVHEQTRLKTWNAPSRNRSEQEVYNKLKIRWELIG